MTITKSLAREMQDALGPDYLVQSSDYDDGPPPRIRIMQAVACSLLWIPFTARKEIAWRLTEAGMDEKIHCRNMEDAAMLEKAFPKLEIVVH